MSTRQVFHLEIVEIESQNAHAVHRFLDQKRIIKYNDQPCPTIHITAEKQDNDWIFKVADNGIGIDPQQGDRIFKIFQRLHSPDEYEGTGIGLAIVKRIVERHGGRIWYDSQPGKGSNFYFNIPGRLNHEI